MEPTSPRKIFAGGLFQIKNPREAESKINPIYVSSVDKYPKMDNIIIPIENVETWHDVKPSMPSIKLNRLTNHNQEIATKNFKKISIKY